MSAPTRVSARARSLKGLRVLYLKGAPKARNTIANVLKQYGAAVTMTGAGRRAVDSLHRERPDTIVTDSSLAWHESHERAQDVRRNPLVTGGDSSEKLVSILEHIESRGRDSA